MVLPVVLSLSSASCQFHGGFMASRSLALPLSAAQRLMSAAEERVEGQISPPGYFLLTYLFL